MVSPLVLREHDFQFSTTKATCSAAVGRWLSAHPCDCRLYAWLTAEADRLRLLAL